MRQIENDINGNTRLRFEAKLLNISDAVLLNTNQKNYKIVGLEFVMPSGIVKQSSGFCFEGNYKYGVEVGKTYMSQVTLFDDGSAIINMSHLPATARPTADMFAEVLTADMVGANATFAAK